MVDKDSQPQREMLKVGQLARRCHKSIRALHLYEELGLLLPAARSRGGFRLYPPEAMARIEWIGKLQDMGLSLTDIQQLLADWSRLDKARDAMGRLRELLDQRMKQTRQQIDRLEALRQEMEDSLGYLERCHSCTAGVPSRCTACDVQNAPMLIAQFHRKGTGEYSIVLSDPSPPANGGQGSA